MVNFGAINTHDCVSVLPPVDTRCNDPAFAYEHPDLCGTSSVLIIKPSVAMACVFGSVKFRAFISTNGIEQDVTDQSQWSTSDMNVAVVGKGTGSATGLSQGEVSISASYQGKNANSKLSVLGGDCCAQRHVSIMVLVDNSKSMSQQFGAGYATRLDFALAAAERFTREVNGNKDKVGLMAFNGSQHTTLAALSSDPQAVSDLVSTITQSQQKTEFNNAISDALGQLTASGADEQVLLLITDGEDTSGQYNDSNPDPIVEVDNFKDQGGIVLCLGVRASTGYQLLDILATGGFLVNAYPGVEAAALDYIAGLKGYICAGNCTPAGDISLPTGTFDYSGFQNWNITGGNVDLLGVRFVDPIPGNGLYVNMSGSSSPHRGLLTSKDTFPILAGHTYRLTVEVASSQWTDDNWALLLKVFSDSQIFIGQNATAPASSGFFVPLQFSFTANAPANVRISFQEQSLNNPESLQWGVLVNRVRFEDVTTFVTLIDDDFDNENVQYIPPACGQGTYYHYLPDLHVWGYSTGTNCYGYGCLDEPVPAQQPDPNPLSNIETGTPPPPPQTYTSTQHACATCPNQQVNLTLSNLIPLMTGASTGGYSVTDEASLNPYGMPTADPGFEPWHGFTGSGFWRVSVLPGSPLPGGGVYRHDASAFVATPNSVHGKAIRITPGPNSIGKLYWLTLFGSPPFPIPAAAPFYDLPFTFPADGSPVTLDFVSEGDSNGFYLQWSWDAPSILDIKQIEILGNGGISGDAVCADASATSTVSQADADSKARAAALAAATAKLNCATAWTSTESYTAHCPVGARGQDVTQSATYTSLISQDDANAQALAAATAAANALLDCTQSNNYTGIIINDKDGTNPQPATPYGSTEYVSGYLGFISGMSVFIKGFSHGSPSDVAILLRGPDGTNCMLMQRCGGPPGGHPVQGITFEFSDDGIAMPDGTDPNQTDVLITNKYKPSQYGAQFDMPLPLDPAPYGTALSVFNGLSPNGAWSLWVVDLESGDAGSISAGWEIVFSTTNDPLILTIGDLHVEHATDTLDAQLGAILPVTFTPGVPAFIMLGDVQNPLTADSAWQRYWNIFGPSAANTIYTPGNHDWLDDGQIQTNATRQFWKGLMASVYGSSFPAQTLIGDTDGFNYSVKIGNWKIICFNSQVFNSDPFALSAGGATYTWLSAQLSEAGFNFIVLCHRPRWSDDNVHGDQADLAPIWGLCAQKGVVAWFSGHAHIDEVQSMRDSIGYPVGYNAPTQIIVGSGNLNLYAFRPGYRADQIKFHQDVQNFIAQIGLNASGLTITFLDLAAVAVPGSIYRLPGRQKTTTEKAIGGTGTQPITDEGGTPVIDQGQTPIIGQ